MDQNYRNPRLSGAKILNDNHFEKKPHNKKRCCGCFLGFSLPAIIILVASIYVYFIAPGRTNILILGIDSRDTTTLGRSDTIILMTHIPSRPYVGILSIPRDLWVEIPGHGYNRINTANFFAEANNPGSGPQLTMETIKGNFGIDFKYYMRLNLIGFLDFIDALGGIEVNLPYATSGYYEGNHHLNGEQALAFVRDRENSDDFKRMERGQIIISALFRKMLNPTSWSKLPSIIKIMNNYTETNFPIWRWPQIAISILRVGPSNIDRRTIDREMVNPFISEGGAYVLAPKWEAINPVLLEMFGQ